MIITIDRFGGLAPRVDPAKLPPHGATAAVDVRLQSGALRGWRKPKRVTPPVVVPPTTRTIYYDTGSGVWFSWGVDVDIVPGPIADLSVKRRYYYTGDGAPKKTDSNLALAGTGAYPRTFYNLGVPRPTHAPTLSNDGGGSGTAETHVYVFTYISLFSGIEEESAPSPPAMITNRRPGDTVTLTWADTVPTAGYNIIKRRIYRSNGGAYLYVGEQAISSTSFADNVSNSALGGALTSLAYDPPPNDLKGLISMPNGFLAGFVGNQIYFSEAYQPHAWPIQYALTVSEQIVALAPVAQGCFVLTEGSPYFVTGVSPDAMTAERINKFAPCLSKRSVATDGIGALYTSYNGVVYVSGGDVKTITEQVFTQEEWNALHPEMMLGIFYDERYTLWRDPPCGNLTCGLVFDRTVQDAPLTMTREPVRAIHMRRDTGTMHFVNTLTGEIMRWDGDDINYTPYEWRSKIFVTPKPVNFGFAQVIHDNKKDLLAEQIQELIAANQTIWANHGYRAALNDVEANQYEVNGSAMYNIPSVDEVYVTLRVYADGNLIFSANTESEKLHRLPAGFRASHWEVEIMSNKGVRRITLATSANEIAEQ